MKYLLLFISLLAFAEELELGGKTLQVKLADTEWSRRKGFQGQKSLDENEGMLFIFEQPQILYFWMKDTTIPLSIGFFDQNQILFQINEMAPLKGTSKSQELAKYALEVKKGWFEKNQIQIGMKFSFPDQPIPVK